jgi:hypothetical protein
MHLQQRPEEVWQKGMSPSSLPLRSTFVRHRLFSLWQYPTKRLILGRDDMASCPTNQRTVFSSNTADGVRVCYPSLEMLCPKQLHEQSTDLPPGPVPFCSRAIPAQVKIPAQPTFVTFCRLRPDVMSCSIPRQYYPSRGGNLSGRIIECVMSSSSFDATT